MSCSLYVDYELLKWDEPSTFKYFLALFVVHSLSFSLSQSLSRYCILTSLWKGCVKHDEFCTQSLWIMYDGKNLMRII